ncbi:GIY-YIG nuclease family protein (plasmid) [Pontibacillus sp. ALD_SL1]|uniref:GIY-YIG nuclease family protein n=1 Tax=Pontibacillus sp. ALD_SL1 TaxID=2777185 RepID=UPI001A97AC3B|nr:GIY-YIG nuclease family protein [Pontibacillus sp. ALD_SL1]QST02277.1 GIY-YIG nuclease family protein [Pontibacillus sp. ALD_SL1]
MQTKRGPRKRLKASSSRSVNLENEMWAMLGGWADEEEISISSVLRKCVDAEIERKKQRGFVYFVQESVTNKVKIGRTKDLERRGSEFIAKMPWDMITLHTIETNNSMLTERLFHEHFKEKRIASTEWFELSREDINYIQSGYYEEQIQKSIAG